MPLCCEVSDDIFIHAPPDISQTDTTTQPPRLIFFITGNPGLIGYYHEFLSLLSQQNSSSSSSHAPATSPEDCYSAGYSLAGFNLTQNSTKLDQSHSHEIATSSQHAQPYGLVEQIDITYARLQSLARTIRSDKAHYQNPVSAPVEVILIGHSVGAYIALEIISRWHHDTSLDAYSTNPGNATDNGPSFTIQGAILLTPTIVDIALSPSGRIATPLLKALPFVPSIAQGAVRVLHTLLPRALFDGLVRVVTGMHHGSTALEMTVKWLRTPGGVKQALWLARDEMQVIGGDRWEEGVWGAVEDAVEAVEGDHNVGKGYGTAPKLVFWFAKKDHWVADRTREKIIEMRGAGRVGVKMVVDETGELVHAWCLKQNTMVANKVRGWIEDILRIDDRP